MSLFKRNEVRNAVMEQVEARINKAQEKFDGKAKEIATETLQAIQAVTEAGQMRREEALKECVADVLR